MREAGTLQARLPGLVAAFSTRMPRRTDETLAPELQQLASHYWGNREQAGRAPVPLLLRQTHSVRVLTLEDGTAPTAPNPDADGASAASGEARLLAVKCADCVPLLLVDEELGSYAALHAGWRGTAGGILSAHLAAWREAGSSLAGVHVELGPHIQGCCYEVQADCLAHFAEPDLAHAVDHREQRTYLHLAAVLQAQALRAGVPATQVRVKAPCTYCHREEGLAPFASYRRDTREGRPLTETNVALIGIPRSG